MRRDGGTMLDLKEQVIILNYELNMAKESEARWSEEKKAAEAKWLDEKQTLEAALVEKDEALSLADAEWEDERLSMALSYAASISDFEQKLATSADEISFLGEGMQEFAIKVDDRDREINLLRRMVLDSAEEIKMLCGARDSEIAALKHRIRMGSTPLEAEEENVKRLQQEVQRVEANENALLLEKADWDQERRALEALLAVSGDAWAGEKAELETRISELQVVKISYVFLFSGCLFCIRTMIVLFVLLSGTAELSGYG